MGKHNNVIGRIDGFLKTTCPRCRRESLGVCRQCRNIATMIVEGFAANLSIMPPEAVLDADSDPDILKAVQAAREAFYNSGVTADAINKLREKMYADVEQGLEELDAQRTDKTIITES